MYLVFNPLYNMCLLTDISVNIILLDVEQVAGHLNKFNSSALCNTGWGPGLKRARKVHLKIFYSEPPHSDHLNSKMTGFNDLTSVQLLDRLSDTFSEDVLEILKDM